MKPERFNSSVRGMLLCALSLLAWGLHAQTPRQRPLGLAWNVRGSWQSAQDHTAIRTGSAIVPGSLVLPDSSNGPHSLTILLPDGQIVLCECFTEENCARGFRVPSLDVAPDAFASDLLARARAAIAQDSLSEAGKPSSLQLPPDEAADVVGAGNTIHFAGLAAAMQNGHYTYDLRPLNSPEKIHTGLSFDKTSRSIAVVVPGPGLYEMTITDSLNLPRIDMLVAALTPAQQATVLKPFEEARARLKEWNENNQGWPVHDVQRAYLESLMLNIKPHIEHSSLPANENRPGTTGEPRFSPHPGLLKGPAKVMLQSDTPGAQIHYTIDHSEPFLSSPVLEAPIVAQKISITIKAFASAPGMKDSAVVTGTFHFDE